MRIFSLYIFTRACFWLCVFHWFTKLVWAFQLTRGFTGQDALVQCEHPAVQISAERKGCLGYTVPLLLCWQHLGVSVLVASWIKSAENWPCEGCERTASCSSSCKVDGRCKVWVDSRDDDGGLVIDVPSQRAASCWLASALTPYSLMPLMSVRSSPWLGLSIPHTSAGLHPSSLHSPRDNTGRWVSQGQHCQPGLVHGSQSWREAMCCAATAGVQLSSVLSCEGLCMVRNILPLHVPIMCIFCCYFCALYCLGTYPRRKALQFQHSFPCP